MSAFSSLSIPRLVVYVTRGNFFPFLSRCRAEVRGGRCVASDRHSPKKRTSRLFLLTSSAPSFLCVFCSQGLLSSQSLQPSPPRRVRFSARGCFALSRRVGRSVGAAFFLHTTQLFFSRGQPRLLLLFSLLFPLSLLLSILLVISSFPPSLPATSTSACMHDEGVVFFSVGWSLGRRPSF